MSVRMNIHWVGPLVFQQTGRIISRRRLELGRVGSRAASGGQCRLAQLCLGSLSGESHFCLGAAATRGLLFQPCARNCTWWVVLANVCVFVFCYPFHELWLSSVFHSPSHPLLRIRGEGCRYPSMTNLLYLEFHLSQDSCQATVVIKGSCSEYM